MSQKKSETLRQREKAQRDLLELKKMQSGEINPDTLKEEKKLTPKTFEEKRQNFFYYHKYKVLVVAVALVVAGYFIWNTVTSPKYDAKVAVCSFENYADEAIDRTETYLEGFYPDLNGDGKVEILAVNCSFDSTGGSVSDANDNMLKMQTLLVGEVDTMLFILDEDSLAYMNALSNKLLLFEDQNIIPLGEEFFGAVQNPFFSEDKKLFLCLRTIEGTSLEEDARETWTAAREAFQKIKDANS